MLEVKFNKATGHWHPHLHVIGEGAYLKKEDLSKAWHKATGDSMITDIRAIPSAKDVAHYVCKYVSKGTSLEVWDVTSAAQEWIIASKGVRTLFTYGTWRGYQLLQVTDDAADWQPVATLVHIYASVERNEPWAIGLMNNLSERRMAVEKHKPPDAVLFEN
jgi:hypothetical protein